MEKGQYTVGGAGQGPYQSQGEHPFPCAQATVWILESQTPRFGQKPQQGDCISRPDQLKGTTKIASFLPWKSLLA